jgi:hypothetical protein
MFVQPTMVAEGDMSDEKKGKWEITSLGSVSLEEIKNFIGYKEGKHEAFHGKSLSRVYTLDNRVQGDYLVGILEEEGIPSIFQSSRDTAFDGIYAGSQGFGHIITADDDSHRARTVIEAVVETIRREAELQEEDKEEKKDDAW